jgi:hypothetical protein
MEKTPEFTPEFFEKLFNGEYPDVIRHTFGLFGTKTEFIIGDEVIDHTPCWLRCMDEEKMQRCTILEVINAPKHLKGEWKQVFDKHKNVIVKYFPTEEEKERRRRINEAYEDTLLMGAVVSSLGRR